MLWTSYVRPYEAMGSSGFAFWLGLSQELATLAVTAFHGLSQVHEYGLGILAWIWMMVGYPRRREETGSSRPSRSGTEAG